MVLNNIFQVYLKLYMSSAAPGKGNGPGKTLVSFHTYSNLIEQAHMLFSYFINWIQKMLKGVSRQRKPRWQIPANKTYFTTQL